MLVRVSPVHTAAGVCSCLKAVKEREAEQVTVLHSIDNPRKGVNVL